MMFDNDVQVKTSKSSLTIKWSSNKLSSRIKSLENKGFLTNQVLYKFIKQQYNYKIKQYTNKKYNKFYKLNTLNKNKK